MESKILSVIERYQMLSRGATVIVAFSGGADSIALLSFLNKYKELLDINLIAAHVNHGIRGIEANSDEQFVKQYCQKIGVELKVLHVDVPAVSKQTRESEEECGRRIRYEFFESIDYNALVATAHTKSDNAETVLFNLTRGTGLRGLCGIPAKRGNIIRPLIECSRSEIEKYCSLNELQYVTDSTNSDTEYSRNLIRHSVIPNLEKINPSLTESISRCVSSLKEDNDLISDLANMIRQKITLENGYDATTLKSEHPSIRKRIISDLVFENGNIHPEQKHIETIDNMLRDSGQIQVAKDCFVRVKGGVIDFPKLQNNIEPFYIPFQNNDIKLSFITIKIKIINNINADCIQKINKDILDNAIDYDKIDKYCVFRNRRDGDVFSPKGRKISKSLKKLFNESRIPTEKRDDIIMLANDTEILWIEGFGPSEKAAATQNTKNILDISIRR